MVEDPLINVQCAIMVTHNAIILDVYDPIMNDVHTYSMDIHVQLWIWYPYAIMDIYTFQELQVSLNELRMCIIELQISIIESIIEL